jgi:hypothetical protein
MNSETKYQLLDENWRNLEQEAGEGLTDLKNQIQSVIWQLPEDPNRGDMQRAVTVLHSILTPYDYGRELLNNINAFIEDEPDDRESYDQLANRFRKWFGKEQNEREQEKVSIPAEAVQNG